MANTISPQSKLVAYTLLISIFSLLMCNGDEISSNTTGFSIDIFPRDSPLSPTYNSSLSPDQHFDNAVLRSNERALLINSHIRKASPYTYLILVKSVYLASLQLGTPRVQLLFFVDTGSNIIWTQCKGCIKCFRQASPYFDPRGSYTYKRVLCATAHCISTRGAYCDETRQFCEYQVNYADKSFTQGQLVTDTITFLSTDRRVESFSNIAFGCGYNNGGDFTGQETGVLGLGSGVGSLVRQLEYTIKGRFSYCLVPLQASKKSSKLNFGDNAIVSGPGTVSTRLFFVNSYFYAVQLDAVSINNVRLEYSTNDTLNSSKSEYGNFLIDNGSTATYLNEYFYHTLVNSLKSYLKLTTVADPGKLFDTCFYAELGAINIDITFHFRGANLNVRAADIFVRRNANVVCFAVLPIDGLSIFGSLTQANLLVGFNLRLGRISFRRFNCELYR